MKVYSCFIQSWLNPSINEGFDDFIAGKIITYDLQLAKPYINGGSQLGNSCFMTPHGIENDENVQPQMDLTFFKAITVAAVSFEPPFGNQAWLAGKSPN